MTRSKQAWSTTDFGGDHGRTTIYLIGKPFYPCPERSGETRRSFESAATSRAYADRYVDRAASHALLRGELDAKNQALEKIYRIAVSATTLVTQSAIIAQELIIRTCRDALSIPTPDDTVDDSDIPTPRVPVPELINGIVRAWIWPHDSSPPEQGSETETQVSSSRRPDWRLQCGSGRGPPTGY